MLAQCRAGMGLSVALGLVAVFARGGALAQTPAGADGPAVLVELFTSEGCSDCPPADALLREFDGHRTADGQLVVGISEHVTYWNRLGWKDPFSADAYTDRQSEYGSRFRLESVYTPQMVVNGREQFVGSDRRALEAALGAESKRTTVGLRIDSVKVVGNSLTFSYSASGLPAKSSLRLVAVLTDDLDESSVLRGENSGRRLRHVAVARVLVPLAILQDGTGQTQSLTLPPSSGALKGTGHHLVLFAQEEHAGAVMGVDAKAI